MHTAWRRRLPTSAHNDGNRKKKGKERKGQGHSCALCCLSTQQRPLKSQKNKKKTKNKMENLNSGTENENKRLKTENRNNKRRGREGTIFMNRHKIGSDEPRLGDVTCVFCFLTRPSDPETKHTHTHTNKHTLSARHVFLIHFQRPLPSRPPPKVVSFGWDCGSVSFCLFLFPFFYRRSVGTAKLHHA